jgi:ABC-2 type transport system permease protein
VRAFLARVLAIAFREARVLRHDPAFMASALAQPIMMSILFGAIISNAPANVEWAVLDRSQTRESRRFVEDVMATGYFVPPVTVQGYDQGRERLRRGRSLMLLVIPHGFARTASRERPRVQVLLDGSDPLTSARIGAYVQETAAAFDPRAERPPEPDLRRAGPIDLRQRFRFNPTLADRNFFLATLAGQLLTNLCLSMAALGLVGERESGTYEQVLSLPTSSLEIVLGKLLPMVGMSYVLFLFAIVLAGFGFGVWPQGSFLALGIVTLPFILSSLAIGVFVSAVSRASAQSVFVAVFFIMPSFVLSGVMFAYQLMPAGIRELGGLLPLRWYQIALRRVFSRGAGLDDVLVPMAAMMGLFSVLLALVLWRMKPRLD